MPRGTREGQVRPALRYRAPGSRCRQAEFPRFTTTGLVETSAVWPTRPGGEPTAPEGQLIQTDEIGVVPLDDTRSSFPAWWSPTISEGLSAQISQHLDSHWSFEGGSFSSSSAPPPSACPIGSAPRHRDSDFGGGGRLRWAAKGKGCEPQTKLRITPRGGLLMAKRPDWETGTAYSMLCHER